MLIRLIFASLVEIVAMMDKYAASEHIDTHMNGQYTGTKMMGIIRDRINNSGMK